MERITSVQNPKVKRAVRLMSSARARREEGAFVLEGLRLCLDVPRSGLTAETVFVTDELLARHGDELEPLLACAEEAFLVPEHVAERLSDTRNPQGVFCVCPSLDKQTGRNKMKQMDAAGKYLLLENVQDPANLGAISRTAEALGLTGLFVSGGCDVTGPKALRASMGALLRLPVLMTDNVTETIQQAEKSGIKTFASTPDQTALPIASADFRGGVLVVVGNEANGVTEETLACCQTRITIPMSGRAESLNAGAAASILMWEMVRPYETS
ncbi:MAG: RNA methyltransferase [Clostridia bacterium]|nr:RNA methyltransferase [Clostridia bacterium]